MSGAVYQPTTVTYESNGTQDRWQDRPISYLASTVTQTARRPCGLDCLPSRSILPIILISTCVASFSLGLVMLIHGALGYSENPESNEDFYLVVTIIGAILFALSILLFVFFLRLTRRMCWRNAKDHMGTSGGQALTVNPSTDLLVAAQYAPVSEVAYQPAQQEDTEQSKLMPQENKELTNEDTDRMVESDPRIVLRPLNPPAHEET
ncbi:uncharacterized protein LOC108912754 [Anoplophora glabripennis]|uniref:uncharacterized protein LOC108912754 n=1 Tax=Anoplophora glabripennis TaxID=217634 RepID=UPI000874E3F2|nr:uncharacterized protein LOC108912754 [Anoplophora glabripennis]XP_018573650.1 uncharacterized protein LOC108912754 [Anoplophora glabripennis]